MKKVLFLLVLSVLTVNIASAEPARDTEKSDIIQAYVQQAYELRN